MPRAFFLVYRKDDRFGNDITLEPPFEWLVKWRQRFPDSMLAVERWMEINVDQGVWHRWDAMIGIDTDEEMIAKYDEYKKNRKEGESFYDYRDRLVAEAKAAKIKAQKEAEEKARKEKIEALEREQKEAEEAKLKAQKEAEKAKKAEKEEIPSEPAPRKGTAAKPKKDKKAVLGSKDIGK